MFSRELSVPAMQSACDACDVDRIIHIAEQVNQSFESSDEEPVRICGQMINDACNTLATSPSLEKFTKVRSSTLIKVLVTNDAVYQILLKIANGLRRPTFIPIFNSMIGQEKGYAADNVSFEATILTSDYVDGKNALHWQHSNYSAGKIITEHEVIPLPEQEITST